MSKKKTVVGIFFGGISPEHEVSIISAEGIISNIDKNLFDVVQIFIDKQGKFWTGDNILEKAKTNAVDQMSPANIGELHSIIDVAFPVLHGEGGEDGSIQGLFQTLGIPFIGCGVAASAICLDKGMFNSLMVASGLLKPKFAVLDCQYDSGDEIKNKIQAVKKDFQFPVFVKPARCGSSVGISKVSDPSKLDEAVAKAKEFDKKIVIEESVENYLEVEVSVLGNNHDDIQASVPGRVIPGAEFYDYDDKYKNDAAIFEVPVKLPQEKIKEIQEIAKRAYMIIGCTGLARVDFLIDNQGKVFLNEINTLPGFTPISMYPKLWEATGLNYQNLITKLISLALSK